VVTVLYPKSCGLDAKEHESSEQTLTKTAARDSPPSSASARASFLPLAFAARPAKPLPTCAWGRRSNHDKFQDVHTQPRNKSSCQSRRARLFTKP